MGRTSERRALRDKWLARYRKQVQRNVLAKPGCHAFTIMLDNLKAGFNVAKIFRSAEVFGAQSVHLVNIGPFDPAPAKGALKTVPLIQHESASSAIEKLLAEGYQLYALHAAGQTSLQQARLPEKAAFLFGHEEEGFSFDLADWPQIRTVGIEQYGRIESLNVSIAASIAMYEYSRQWDKSS